MSFKGKTSEEIKDLLNRENSSLGYERQSEKRDQKTYY